MSSLVAEALKSSGSLDRNDLQSEIIRISRQMETLKLQVQSLLTRCYVDFDPLVVAAFGMGDKLRQVDTEAQSIKGRIEKELKPHLICAVSEYEDLAQRAQNTTILADLLSQLVAISEALQGSANALISKDYLKASRLLDDARTRISSAESFWKSCGSVDLTILESLRTEYVVQKENLIFTLGQLWSQHIVWVDKEQCSLRVYTVKDDNASTITQALSFLDQLDHKLKIFSKNLMVHLVAPVLRLESEVVVNKNASYVELGIKTKSSNQPKAHDVIQTLQSLFACLFDVFDTLNNSDTNHNHNLMGQLGKICAEEFCNRLIKECLEPAVPSHSKDFDTYKAVSGQTEELESFLKETGFLSSSHCLSYAQNFDSLFSSKRCQEILVQARETMKEDLHVTLLSDRVHIVMDDSENVFIQEDGKEDDLEHAFSFPKCQISEFTGRILNQLHDVLEEACTSKSKEMAVRLFYTARHISQMYCDLVPIYHHDSILLFPQQTAIHHNNCMFLAHHLMTLFHGYNFVLNQKGLQGPKTFIDVALQLRTLGTESFLQQMRRQRSVLLEFLQDHGVFQNMSGEELLSKGSRAVKQCMVHLMSLRKVWLPILPWEVYLRSVGTLCNSCLEEIIFRVFSQDDITEKTAGHLDSILASLDAGIPRLFEGQKGSDVGGNIKPENKRPNNEESDWRVLCLRHIKKWAKFQELRIILKSSLRDIVERWASGQGPLASEATADEVKQLIRALFQNTDRRAAALAKIK